MRLPAASAAIEVIGPDVPRGEEVLTSEALYFVAALVREFAPRLSVLLRSRRERQELFESGVLPDFLPETRSVRESDWACAEIPADLRDRRVEITGPVDRKMVINALNSGARVFMADFEDSTAPTWANLVQGQVNLRDAVAGDIRYEAPETGKLYTVGPRPAVLMVRPRGLHLPEAHLRVDGRETPGAFVDFGLFFFHNARALLAKGSGPYFYIPKLQSHLEARLWNDVFLRAQEQLGLAAGTIRATVLIETLPAAFEMDEILYELREHAAGLNCGRWDYIFSFIKTLRNDPSRVLPDRSQVTMDKAFLRAYSRLLVQICHRRGVHAMGGMAAQIPIKDDPAGSAAALEKVRADKLREVGDGHDGTWVAHPGLVALAQEVFDAQMPEANQIRREREAVEPSRDPLLELPEGIRSEAGLRRSLRVSVRYLAAWLSGIGCVPLDNLMEDAATAEICRAQIWQWIHHRARLEDGREVTAPFCQQLLSEESSHLRNDVGDEAWRAGRYEEAAELFGELMIAPELADFLTLPAYQRIVSLPGAARV